MIDLERLIIKPGDIVKSNQNFFELEAREFVVKEVKIVNMVQMVYPEVGPPVPASEVTLVKKSNESRIEDMNRIALSEILNNIFKDNWDIVPNINRSTNLEGINISDTSFILLIRFPEFVIKNSKNEQHTIRDLFVAVPLQKNYRVKAIALYGTRTTFTNDELSASYIHSHLPGGGFGSANSFCLGSGIIRESFLIAQGVDPSKDPLVYEMFFENLDSYVRWESIEGGPYRNIGNIHTGGGSLYASSTATNTMKIIKKHMRIKNYEIPFNMNINLKSFSDFKTIMTIDRENLKRSLRDFVLNNFDDISKDISSNIGQVIVQEFNGIQYRVSRNNEVDTIKGILLQQESSDEELRIENKGDSNLVFKGERIQRKLITSTKSSLKKQDLSINNNLIDTLINNFNYIFYGKLFATEDSFKDSVINYKA